MLLKMIFLSDNTIQNSFQQSQKSFIFGWELNSTLELKSKGLCDLSYIVPYKTKLYQTYWHVWQFLINFDSSF